MSKHLIVLGDSLTQPRSWDGVGVTDTYAFLLQKRLAPAIGVSNLGLAENDTRRQLGEFLAKRTFVGAEANYIVIHLGIVDCAPRLFWEPERLLVSAATRIPLVRSLANAYIRIRSRYRYPFTKVFRLVRVSLEEFETNFRQLLHRIRQENPVEEIFLVNIAYPGVSLVSKSYGVVESIGKYNRVIDLMASEHSAHVVDVFEFTKENPSEITIEDGHHIRAGAHKFIAEAIAAHLAECLPRHASRIS